MHHGQFHKLRSLCVGNGFIPALLLFVLALSPQLLLAGAGKALSPYTYKQLTAIQQQMDDGSYDAALQGLKKLLDASASSAFEQAVIQQMLGYVQISRESYPAAVKAFEQSLSLQQLPESSAQNLRYNLGQLYLTRERPDKAIAILESWLEQASGPSAAVQVLLAQARIQQQQYRKAIPHLQQAISLSDEPHVEWYETLLAMHYELQSYRACIPVLKKMIRLFPQHVRYWQQLAGVYMALNDQDAALAALELAHRQGALTGEPALLQLAQLYMATGVPYKAARLLEQQIDIGKLGNTPRHQELLAHAWSNARERKQAIGALERALRVDAKPELRLQLAQWYVEAGNWRGVTEVLASLEGKNNDRTVSQARLLLGIAHFELGNTEAAREAFRLAQDFPKTSTAAGQWLDFIDSLAASNV